MTFLVFVLMFSIPVLLMIISCYLFTKWYREYRRRCLAERELKYMQKYWHDAEQGRMDFQILNQFLGKANNALSDDLFIRKVHECE